MTLITRQLGTDSTSLDIAAQLLRTGHTVALPTETVYGLGANALDADAVAKIFVAKERPHWDPLIVHIADIAQLDTLVTDVPEAARKLMDAFWPGPLTLLLLRTTAIPDAVTAARPLVGIRIPAHPIAREVLRRAQVPVAAPSANRFGRTSPTTAAHVLEDLDGRIDAIVDAGATEHGLESTVLDATVNPMLIYRPGAISIDALRAITPNVAFFAEPTNLTEVPHEALPSPGLGLRHYAPRARLILIDSTNPTDQLTAAATEYKGERIGLMLPDGIGPVSSEHIAETYPWGHWNNAETLAHALFAGLRTLDAQGCTVILCPMPATDGVGLAIRDRLRKAAAK